MGPDVGRSAWPLVTQPSQHTLGPTASRSPDAKAVTELRPVGHRGHLRFIVSTRRQIFRFRFFCGGVSDPARGGRPRLAQCRRAWRLQTPSRSRVAANCGPRDFRPLKSLRSRTFGFDFRVIPVRGYRQLPVDRMACRGSRQSAIFRAQRPPSRCSHPSARRSPGGGLENSGARFGPVWQT